MEPSHTDTDEWEPNLYLTKKQRVKQFQSTAEITNVTDQRSIQQQLQLQQQQMKMHNAHFQMMQEQQHQQRQHQHHYQQHHHHHKQQQQQQRSFTYVPKESSEFENIANSSVMNNLGKCSNLID
jgi:hypothetical protein